MAQYVINPINPPYYLPKPSIFYVSADNQRQSAVNSSSSNVPSRILLSEGNSSLMNPLNSLETQNLSLREGPRPFLSPPRKANMSINEQNVDDIVSKCLSRTQKLIEEIKKTKKHDNSSFQTENDRNISNNMIFPISPQKKMILSPFKRSTPSRGVINSIHTDGYASLRRTPSPSKFVIKTAIISNNSPIRLRDTPSPIRLIVPRSLNNTPSRFSTNYIFINPSYIANEIESYIGDITENKPHGRGTCLYKTGYKYEGQFQMGVKQGFGVLKGLNDEEVYVGDWELGKFQGDGILVNPSMNSEENRREMKDFDYKEMSNFNTVWCKYEGSFLEGRMHDLGTLYIKNGDKFRGKFMNGGINGEGSYYFKNGDIVMGLWEKGRLLKVF